MRIVIPHNTDKETARKKINEKLGQLFGQFGHFLKDSKHEWEGDVLNFAGSAKGFKISGSVVVTDEKVIIEGKLPLLAKPMEPRIRSTVEKEAESLFA